ncbi:MAG TPA: hypothetical protein VIH93_16985 [Thermoanaerobaculia bacterium]
MPMLMTTQPATDLKPLGRRGAAIARSVVLPSRPVRRAYALVSCVVALLSLPGAATAGGAWVPEPGHGDVSLGFSDKSADRSYDVQGNAYFNRSGGQRSYHDFRYLYLSGEAGLFKRLSLTYLFTYLDGYEGVRSAEEKNAGLSDAWLGLKYALRTGDLPMAIAFTYRTPYFYDLQGPYNRHLFDANGKVKGVSPEWRGLLKEDYTLSYLISRSMLGRGWWNVQAGYSWREGAPADAIPISADAGFPLPFLGSWVKVAGVYVGSRHNDSRAQPDDRFGSSATNNFNDAEMLKGGVSWLLPLAHRERWFVEVGYNQWLWGRSARIYKEPFFSIDRRY